MFKSTRPYRGKSKRTDEWVEGLLGMAVDGGGGRFAVIQVNAFDYWSRGVGMAEEYGYKPRYEEIDPKTVGQYTGVDDMNGRKIFEGDIVLIHSDDYMGFNERGIVTFQNGCYGVCYTFKWGKSQLPPETIFHRFGVVDYWQDMGASGTINYTYKVLGNYYDNPILLKG